MFKSLMRLAAPPQRSGGLQGCEDCGAWFDVSRDRCPACETYDAGPINYKECRGCGAPPTDSDDFCLDCLDTITEELYNAPFWVALREGRSHD